MILSHKEPTKWAIEDVTKDCGFETKDFEVGFRHVVVPQRKYCEELNSAPHLGHDDGSGYGRYDMEINRDFTEASYVEKLTFQYIPLLHVRAALVAERDMPFENGDLIVVLEQSPAIDHTRRMNCFALGFWDGDGIGSVVSAIKGPSGDSIRRYRLGSSTYLGTELNTKAREELEKWGIQVLRLRKDVMLRLQESPPGNLGPIDGRQLELPPSDN